MYGTQKVIRVQDPNQLSVRISIYADGKLMIMGAASEQDAIVRLRQVARQLQRVLASAPKGVWSPSSSPPLMWSHFQVHQYHYKGHVGMRWDWRQALLWLPSTWTYKDEQQQMAGVYVWTHDEHNTSCSWFDSGSVLLRGKNVLAIWNLFAHTCYLARRCCKEAEEQESEDIRSECQAWCTQERERQQTQAAQALTQYVQEHYRQLQTLSFSSSSSVSEAIISGNEYFSKASSSSFQDKSEDSKEHSPSSSSSSSAGVNSSPSSSSSAAAGVNSTSPSSSSSSSDERERDESIWIDQCVDDFGDEWE